MQGHPYLLETTLGRALFNEALPEDYPFFNQQAGKSQISAIVNDLAERYPKTEVAATLDRIKDAGFRWATRSGVTVALSDIITPPDQGRDRVAVREAGRQGAVAVREGSDDRPRASPGAHPDLDQGHRRGRQGHAGELPDRQHHQPHGDVGCSW